MKPKTDYRLYLERAARQMILVRKVDTLTRLIIRTIMRTVRVNHAGILLFDKARDEFIVKVSKGEQGIKIPEGFTKIKKDNPLIRYFTDEACRAFKQDFLLYHRINYYLASGKFRRDPGLRAFLWRLKDELSLYQAKAFIPGFYRNELIGVLFLGAKKDRSAFTPDELGFLSVLASDVVMAIKNAWLFEDLNHQLDLNKKLFLNTVTAFATAIEAKDKYTIGHTERVVHYATEMARGVGSLNISNWGEFEETLRVAALLHDIGKIGIPEKVLNKKTPLTDKERACINKHPITGEEILDSITEFKDVILGVKYHHERYDGKGYPCKLAGEQIPVLAAIIAVADSYDAMTSDRPYRKALTHEQAIDEIKRNRGTQFNPKIVDIFLKIFEKNSDALPSPQQPRPDDNGNNPREKLSA